MNTISISEMINVFRHDTQWDQIISKVLNIMKNLMTYETFHESQFSCSFMGSFF